jgi:hypothetical protein
MTRERWPNSSMPAAAAARVIAVTRDAALAYAGQLCWPVLPLTGKVPAIRGGRGYLDATTDADTIWAYWGRYPHANVGVSCIGSGFVALDIDPRYGGDRTLAEIESRYGPLQHTVRQVTGGGGEHILFRAPRDFQARGSIGSGIDVKWRGSIVVSPSIHPDTGRRYTWAAGHHPLRTPLADQPAWLVDLLAPHIEPSPIGQARPVIEEDVGWGSRPWYSRAALQRACEAIEVAPVGQQDQTLNRECYGIGRLIGAGLMPRRLAIDCLVYHAVMMVTRPAAGRGGSAKSNRKSSAPSAGANCTPARSHEPVRRRRTAARAHPRDRRGHRPPQRLAGAEAAAEWPAGRATFRRRAAARGIPCVGHGRRGTHAMSAGLPRGRGDDCRRVLDRPADCYPA